MHMTTADRYRAYLHQNTRICHIATRRGKEENINAVQRAKEYCHRYQKVTSYRRTSKWFGCYRWSFRIGGTETPHLHLRKSTKEKEISLQEEERTTGLIKGQSKLRELSCLHLGMNPDLYTTFKNQERKKGVNNERERKQTYRIASRSDRQKRHTGWKFLRQNDRKWKVEEQ
uniref:Uncharacterized protein n=1 Tax=Solanum tuberosum TaxID=4113 RepID=M1D3V8_SOLTU